MVLKSEQDRIRALLKDTITLLCRNGLTFKTEFSIEALIGITLDQDDVMLVSINESIRTELGSKLAAAQNASETGEGQQQEDNYDDYSDISQEHSPSSPGSAAKRRRKRRRSSGQGSKAADDEDSGGGSGEESDVNQEEPPSKRITAKMKNAVKQEDDDDSKDIVFIKEEVEHSDWQSTHSQHHHGNNYQHDLSGIPSTSSSSLQQPQDNFDFLQGNTLIPMGTASQSGGAGLWPDMSQQQHQPQQQQQHLGQNMTSPASKRTSTVTSNMSATPSGDDSQQVTIVQSVLPPSDGKKGYVCDKCFKTIHNKTMFLQHMERHRGIFRYHCPTCGKGFSARNNLVDHERQHTGEVLACAFCPSKFRSTLGFKSHMKKVHKMVSERKKPPPQDDQHKRYFPDDQSKRAFQEELMKVLDLKI